MSDQLEAPRSRTGLIVAVIVIVVGLVAAAFFFLRDGSGAGPDAETVRIGVVDETEEHWDLLKEDAADENIDIEYVNFDEYTQPNPALDEGAVDINQFQHILFLAEHRANNEDSTIVPLGSTATYPLNLYSEQYDSVEDIPEGETVIVADDPTNRARGLLLLQSAGLIELEDGGNAFSTPNDIVESESRVTVEEFAADTIPAAIREDRYAGGIINNNFATDAGLDPADAIAADDAEADSSAPYINVFAVNEQDQDNETYLTIVELYHANQDILDNVQQESGDTAVFVDQTAEELTATLEETIADYGESN